MTKKESQSNDWVITPELSQLAQETGAWIKQENRQAKLQCVEDWRGWKPSYKGKGAVFADLIHGHLTAEGVKYAPIYVNDDQAHVEIHIVMSQEIEQPADTEFFMQQSGYNYLLCEVNIEEVRRKGIGKIITTEEFLIE